MKTFYGLLISLLLSLAMKAFAANIQDIRVYSSLNQPLVADIPVFGIDRDIFAHMQVTLASGREFAEQQITYLPLYAELDLVKALSANQTPVVRITSRSIVTEPALSLLIKFQFNHSLITRQFTALLDPPTEYVTRDTGTQLSAKIPVLTALDAAANYAAIVKPKPQPVNPVDKQPTSKLPLPTSAELQASVKASNRAPKDGPTVENERLILAQKLDNQDAGHMKPVLPAWIDNKSQQQQTVIPQDPATAVAGQPKAMPKKNISTSGNKNPSAERAVPALHKLPLVDKPKPDTNKDLLWLLLLIVVGGLVWRYRNKLPERLKKKWFAPNSAKAPRDSIKPVAISQKAVPAQNGATTQNHDGELDPLEESEVLYNYGRYEQAETVLLAAIQAEAGRTELYLKLLEVYGIMNKLDNFKRIVDKMPTEARIGDVAFDTKLQYLQDKFFNKSEPKAGSEDTAEHRNVLMELSLKPESFALLNQKQDHVNDKIRIAKACIEMQDYQSAKQILNELKGEGTVEQNEEIQQLMNNLPDNNTIEFKSEE